MKVYEYSKKKHFLYLTGKNRLFKSSLTTLIISHNMNSSDYDSAVGELEKQIFFLQAKKRNLLQERAKALPNAFDIDVNEGV